MRQPGDELHLIIGADAFHELGTWYRKSEVFTMTEFIGVARPGFDYQAPKAIDPHVLAYIREQRLYRR